jgi:hypothetical protein
VSIDDFSLSNVTHLAYIQSHSRCSETFYRKEIQTSIDSEPSRSVEEKLKMMELLKRIEQQSRDDDPNHLDPDNEDMEGDDGADLTKRFAGMDIGKPRKRSQLRV